MNKIDLNPGYLINGYLNNQLIKNTDEKTRKLNSVAIIRTYCLHIRNYLQKFGLLLLLLQLKFSHSKYCY